LLLRRSTNRNWRRHFFVQSTLDHRSQNLNCFLRVTTLGHHNNSFALTHLHSQDRNHTLGIGALLATLQSNISAKLFCSIRE